MSLGVAELARLRLRTQRLVGPAPADPVAVVRALGAVQAQDWAGAKWAIARRCEGATDADLDAALAGGSLIRTHVLRPTWHVVAPEDLRAMLALTAPRVKAQLASYDRTLEIDAPLVARSRAVLAESLAGGATRTRAELGAALAAAGIVASGARLGHLVMHAEQDAVLCSGGLRGKQITYAAFDDRVPPGGPIDREAVRDALAWRYLEGHGPATAKDFAWWSGLTGADAKAAFAAIAGRAERLACDGETYLLAPGVEPADGPVVRLLPNYDELTVAYRGRAVMTAPGFLGGPAGPLVGSVLANVVTVDGRAVGAWKRELGKARVAIAFDLHVPLDAAAQAGLAAEVARYGAFLGKDVVVAKRAEGGVAVRPG